MSYIYVELGPHGRITVDEDKITIAKSRRLAKAVVAVKQKHSPLLQHPLKDGETVDDWQKRVLPLLKKTDKEDTARRKGESNEAYLERIMSCESDDFELYYDILNTVQAEVGEPNPTFPENVISKAAFEEISTEAAVKFLRTVLGKAKIDVDSVFPKRFELPDII